MPKRWSPSSRWASGAVDMPGAPWRISLKVQQPFNRFRTMTGVHRSAGSSELRAIGQN
jgi:hypothetical protein